jgi:hypothetical protein
MKGDFSRLRFAKARHYTSVLTQQGRVQLDADANEQRAIDEHLWRTETRDIIGPSGAPKDGGGFEISLASRNVLMISKGRYYVDGLLCENEQDTDYTQQQYLINPQPALAGMLTNLRRGTIQAIWVFLQAWQRFVTALDDPCIKEVALGEADTTGRLQTVWRVVAVPVAPTNGLDVTDCCAQMRRPVLVAAPGTLSAFTSGASDSGSCLPAPSAGYRGLENQLYRVEIHQGGDTARATFKWSRDNGSVLTKIVNVSGKVVEVDSLGLDANLGFAANQWVEVSDDSSEFGPFPNQPGSLLQIDHPGPGTLALTLKQLVPQVDTVNGHAKLRRWDQSGSTATTSGVPLSAGTPVDLENGIQVQFSQDGVYSPGDYWLIPARTATGDIDWPPCDGDNNPWQPPKRTIIHRTGLACIHYDRKLEKFTIEPCRQVFYPLVDLTPSPPLPALHVVSIGWPNDDRYSVDQLVANGLSVTLDQAPISTIDASNFIVTLEVPIEVLLGRTQVSAMAYLEQVSAIMATIQRVLLGIRNSWILEGIVTVNPKNSQQIIWKFQSESGLAILERLMEVLAANGVFLRARVTLKGRTIFGSANGTSLFLDGQVFGQAGKRSDGTPRIDLVLPSGSSQAGSDFESWFELVPTVTVTTFTITPAKVAVVAGVIDPATGRPKVVDATGTPNPNGPSANIQGQITLNYPPHTETTIAHSLASVAPTASPLSFQPFVSVKKGTTSPPALGIQITGAIDPKGQTFTLNAALTGPTGRQVIYSAPLAVSVIQPTGTTGSTPAPKAVPPESPGSAPNQPKSP